MTARLLLVRHGQIAANVERVWHGSTDSPLTEQGEHQARCVATHLAATVVATALYTSPLQRARATAAPIASALGLAPQALAGLAEYGLGELEGVPYDELATRHRFYERTDDVDWAPPEGESLRLVATRVIAAWRTMTTAHPGATVIAVTHGAALAIGLAQLFDDDPRVWSRYHVRNTSVTELVLEPAPRLVAIDVVEHLP